MLLAAVPVGLILTLGVLGGWSLLGAGRAEQAAAVLSDWLVLAGTDDFSGAGPFAAGFGESFVAEGEAPLSPPWQEEVADAIASAKEKGLVKGLILDVRNSPGGVMGASVEMAGALLDGELVVYTQGRHPQSDNRYEAEGLSIELRNF